MAFFIDAFSLSFVDIEVLIRLVIAVVLGAAIGLEREYSHKPAGLRTHMLVCLGAALFTTVSIFSFGQDPARVAAGIVTGIGFIGAGSIIASRGHVHGLTTAATMWVTAAVGLAIGLGEYVISIVITVIIFLILNLRRVERAVPTKKRGPIF